MKATGSAPSKSDTQVITVSVTLLVILIVEAYQPGRKFEFTIQGITRVAYSLRLWLMA